MLERLDVKHALYAKLEGLRKADAVVSSNTSTIPLAELTKGASEDFTKHFMIAHFFNPPRYMRLLEVVKSDKTLQSAYENVCRFADIHLGKSIVPCKGIGPALLAIASGFIGCRLQCWKRWLLA